VKLKLLIVDDDEDLRKQMAWSLADDYEVIEAADRPSALQAAVEKRPDVVLLDLGLPPQPNDPEEGFLALSEILDHSRQIKVVIITGQSDKENAMRAIGEGAYDFLCKPIQSEELKIILRRAGYVAGLEKEYHQMQHRLGGEGFEGMLGGSPQMQDVFTTIRKVATTDVPVLILGESGTGKEMAALAIHNTGSRKNGPFIAINCSAIPETLLESELFGHEKGAFTGAHIQRMGRIESASGGTLFLDEIGELSASLQVKLLRFLQEQRIERIGGRKVIEIDARVIAATNSDLKQAMAESRFREDLFYRLAVVVLWMPPFRERSGDVPLLAKSFLKRFAAERNGSASGFSPQAMRAMEAHLWPGNVREMENRIRRAVIMAEHRQITPADLELESMTTAPRRSNLKEARESLERDMIQNALTRHRGKISRAASELGITRPTLYDLMTKLGIERAD
jgi:two-component system, NtrC family, response regulator